VCSALRLHVGEYGTDEPDHRPTARDRLFISVWIRSSGFVDQIFCE